MAVMAATTGAENAETTTAILQAADTLTNIALAIARADSGQALLEPATAVTARAELTRFADHLADGSWQLPDDPDPDQRAARHQRVREAVLHDIQYLT